MELLRIQLVQCRSQFDPQLGSIESIAPKERDVDSLAHLALMLAGRGSKADRYKSHAGDFSPVQMRRQFTTVDPGSAHQLKGGVGSPADGNVRALDQRHTRIELGLDQTAQIGRWIHPLEPSRVIPVAANPACHGHDCQPGIEVALGIEHLRQLSDGHAMTHRKRKIVHEAFPPSIGDRPLHEGSRDRIRPVEHNDFDAGLGRGLEKIAQGGLVGVKASACVLNVDHDRVERLQHLERRMAGRLGGAIDAIDGHARRGILRVADIGRIEGARDSVLGTEDGRERNAGNLRQHINGASPRGIHSGLIGQHADLFLFGDPANDIEVMGLENVDSGLDRSVACAQPPGRSFHFVVAGYALPAQRFLLAHRQGKRRRYRGCNLGSHRHRASFASGMHGVGQNDDEGAGRRINPQGSSGEAGVAERSDRKQRASV